MNYQILERKYLANTYPFRGLTIVRGKGVYLYDSEGKKYLDMMSNYGINIFGHSHPKIIKALKTQLSKLINLHSSFTNDQRALASELLVKKCDQNLTKVFWSNSGSEAVEAALKFAVLATKKKKFIAAKGSYHGKTLGSLSVTFNQKYRKSFEPLLWEVDWVEFGDLQEIKKVIDQKTAAVILEPIQGERGIILSPANYLKKVREICDEQNVLLIIDEIQTGLGRTGSFLASQGVKPDILCLGKALGGGIPIGATIITEEIAKTLSPGIHTSTFGGNPLALAGALAVLNLIDEKLLSRVQKLGDYFLKRLREIKSQQIKEVRGKGLMLALELKLTNTPILKALQERRILAIPARENVVRFLPPFIIEKKHIDQVIRVLKEIF